MNKNMVSTQELINYLNQLLQVELFQDYCPNGLQIEGQPLIKKIISGVTASQEFLDKAGNENADAILVHHGYFWRGEDPVIVGIKRNRIRTVLQHEMNLLVYHLPLDAHSIFGNNAQLAKVLNIQVTERLDVPGAPKLLYMGELSTPMNGEEFANFIEGRLNRKPFHCGGRTGKVIKKIAWCTGAGQDFIYQAIDNGCQAFITGEVSERTFHIAKETDLHFYAAGHHATERYGIKSLGEHLQFKFGIEHKFIDVDNPI